MDDDIITLQRYQVMHVWQELRRDQHEVHSYKDYILL